MSKPDMASRQGAHDSQAARLPTILIVDDNLAFRSFVRRLLDAEGFHVIGEAEDGESAIRATRELSPDVVLLDVVLPDIDGFAVCAQLTESERPPAVVMTSSREVSTYRRRLRESRARGFVPKGQVSGAAIIAVVGLGP
jgi:DNA-binding NarL/FixJ family response regulator